VFSDELIRPWLDALLEELPELSFVDAHTHIGRNDPDGYTCEPDELIASLEGTDGRALVFAMHEPDGYPGPNDRAVDAALASDGKLRALCRLDPSDDPLAEAERSLARGAKGIKLHPRAEQFQLDVPELRDVFALADERRLPVLVHAGRGIPALGRHAVDVCERHPGLRLILAHAGICDLAWIWRAAQEQPNLYFDTSWWSPADLLTLFALVPPGQILFASDAPYGQPTFAAINMLRYALQVGMSHEQIAAVMGAQADRVIEGEEPLDPGPPVGAGNLGRDVVLERVQTFLVSAMGQMFQGVEPAETLQLAALACEVGDGAPQAEICAGVLGLLELRERMAEGVAPQGPRGFPPWMPLILAASVVCATPDVRPPVVPATAGVGDRTER
jgi:uncharacterized protein